MFHQTVRWVLTSDTSQVFLHHPFAFISNAMAYNQPMWLGK